jgi:hypothetical protein
VQYQQALVSKREAGVVECGRCGRVCGGLGGLHARGLATQGLSCHATPRPLCTTRQPALVPLPNLEIRIDAIRHYTVRTTKLRNHGWLTSIPTVCVCGCVCVCVCSVQGCNLCFLRVPCMQQRTRRGDTRPPTHHAQLWPKRTQDAMREIG